MTVRPVTTRLLGALVFLALLGSACGDDGDTTGGADSDATADAGGGGETSTTVGTTARPPKTLPPAVATTTSEPGSADLVDLTSVDFQNRHYDVFCGDAIEVDVVDGLWDSPDGLGAGSVGVGFIDYADLTDDGRDEALVELSCSVGANGFFPEVLVFEPGSDDAVLLGRVEGVYVGLSPSFPSAFDVSLLVYGPEDPGCCPSAERVETWQYDGGTLALVDSVDTPLDGGQDCVVPVVGDQLLGFGLGSDMAAVVAAVTEVCGIETVDDDWNPGCPLDFGDEVDDERIVFWGDFGVRFARREPDPTQLDAHYDGGPPPTDYGAPSLTGWFVRNTDGAEPLVELTFPGPVFFGQTLDEVAGALGVTAVYDTDLVEIFGLALVSVDGIDYVGFADSPATAGAAPLDSVYVGGIPLCD